MKKSKVAFQGELGAYSHIAINELFKNPEIKTCATFEETFKVAFEDEDYKIVIPLENSLAGRVADIHYLLPKYKLQIHAEHFQKVEHNLLAKENSKIEDITSPRTAPLICAMCIGPVGLAETNSTLIFLFLPLLLLPYDSLKSNTCLILSNMKSFFKKKFMNPALAKLNSLIY